MATGTGPVPGGPGWQLGPLSQWKIGKQAPLVPGKTPPLRQTDPFTGRAASWTSALPKGAVKAGGALTPPESAAQIKAMQQFLRNRGYNISVDGIRGPETSAAVL